MAKAWHQTTKKKPQHGARAQSLGNDARLRQGGRLNHYLSESQERRRKATALLPILRTSAIAANWLARGLLLPASQW
jgi:hypothetical protein